MFAGLYPEHGLSHAGQTDAFTAEYAGTQPGAYLQLAAALRNMDDATALANAGEITQWDEDADPQWLSAPAIPARVRCGHLLAQGAERLTPSRD